MIPLALLSQIYVVSLVVGAAFIGINLFMGNLHDSGDDGGAGGGDDVGGGGGDDVGGGGGGGDAGSADGGGGDDFGGSSDAGSSGDDFGGSNTGGKLLTPAIARTTFFGAAHHHGGSTGAHRGAISTHSTPIMPRLSARIGSFLLGLLSPMALAMFMTFFGTFGLLFDRLMPWMGFFTIIPAILFSTAISNVFKYFVRYLIVHGNVSTEAKVDDTIGQVGEIITPIVGGRPGEVTYVVGSKRYHSTAKPSKEGIEFKRGSKVLITGIQDHVVFVDEYNLLELQ